MTEIKRKRTGELLRKLFAILMHEPEGLQAGEALARIAEGETLSEYETSTDKSWSSALRDHPTLGLG
jgi:restriction system protein